MEEEIDVDVKEYEEPRVATQAGGTGLPQLSIEVFQKVLAFLSELPGTGATPMVQSA